MTAVELQEDRPEVRGDLKDRIHGVRLEVEKVRNDVAKVETRLVEKMGRLEVRLIEKIGESENRLGEKMADRIDGVERTVRGWLVAGVTLIGAMIALAEVLGR